MPKRRNTDKERWYVCTVDSWYNIEQIGKSIHPDTTLYYFECFKTTSRNKAKLKFIDSVQTEYILGNKRIKDPDFNYTDVKVRLLSNPKVAHLY